MRIARDGTWYHQGAPISRPAMVRLFSTILRREPDGSHVLVTPVEKLAIEVESTAFRAIEMTSEGEGRAAPDRAQARQRRRAGRRPRPPAAIVDDRRRPEPAGPRPPRARGRAQPRALLRAGRDRAGRRRRPARHLERRRLLSARATPNEPGRAPARRDRPAPRGPSCSPGDLARGRSPRGRPAAVLVAVTDRPRARA